jgi:hypothetical protein
MEIVPGTIEPTRQFATRPINTTSACAQKER